MIIVKIIVILFAVLIMCCCALGKRADDWLKENDNKEDDTHGI